MHARGSSAERSHQLQLQGARACPILQLPALQDLHLIKAQCSTSTLVTKIKIVERYFADGVTVEFHMHDVAPAAPPAPLPYFANGSDVLSDENAVAKYLAENGAQKLSSGDNILPGAIEAVIQESPAVRDRKSVV